jgi:hypothetical protein
MRDDMITKLANTDYFSITTDAWSSSDRRKFVGVTFHRINEFTLEKHTACVFELASSHSWRLLTTAVALRIEQFLPSEAVLTCITTDNGSNFLKLAASLYTNLDVAAIEQIGPDSWDEPSEVEDPCDSHSWRCVAHKMNLVIRHVIDDNASESIKRVRDVVLAIRSSCVLQQAYKDIVETQGGKVLMPILDVETRWSSTYHMITRFLELWQTIMLMFLSGRFDENHNDIEVPTPSDIEIVTSLKFLLKPAAEFTKFIEGEKYPTLPLVAPQIMMVKNSWEHFRCTNTTTTQYRDLLMEQFNHYFSFIWTIPNLALAASALHPCYGHLDFITSTLRDEVWKYLEELIEDYGSVHNNDGTTGILLSPSGNPLPSMNTAGQTASRRRRDALRRLREFMEEKHFTNIELPSNFDALKWWKELMASDNTRHSFYPISHLVKILYAIMATSAPTERLFSLSGNIFNKKNTRMNSSTFEDLFFIAHSANELGTEQAIVDQLLNRVLAVVDRTAILQNQMEDNS